MNLESKLKTLKAKFLEFKAAIKDVLAEFNGKDLTNERSGDKVIKVNGKGFRCSCGCNVFQNPNKREESIYECNSCGELYSGE